VSEGHAVVRVPVRRRQQVSSWTGGHVVLHLTRIAVASAAILVTASCTTAGLADNAAGGVPVYTAFRDPRL
jgi:hypothetical protein